MLELSDRRRKIRLGGDWEDRLFPVRTRLAQFVAGQADRRPDLAGARWQSRMRVSPAGPQAVLRCRVEGAARGAASGLAIQKVVTLGEDRCRLLGAVRLRNDSKKARSLLFAAEMRFEIKDGLVNRVGETLPMRRFALQDPERRLRLLFRLSRPARLWHFPLERREQACDQWIRRFDGVSLTWLWPVALRRGGTWSVRWEVESASPQESFEV